MQWKVSVMKRIIDDETGEILEVEDKNELAQKKLYEVGAIDERTNDFLNDYIEMQEQYEIFKEKLQEAMIKHRTVCGQSLHHIQSSTIVAVAGEMLDPLGAKKS